MEIATFRFRALISNLPLHPATPNSLYHPSSTLGFSADAIITSAKLHG